MSHIATKSFDEHADEALGVVEVIRTNPRHRGEAAPWRSLLDPLTILAGGSAVGVMALVAVILLRWFGLI